MKVTKDEYKNKWCPERKKCGSPFCIGPACMAWVEAGEEFVLDDNGDLIKIEEDPGLLLAMYYCCAKYYDCT